MDYSNLIVVLYLYVLAFVVWHYRLNVFVPKSLTERKNKVNIMLNSFLPVINLITLVLLLWLYHTRKTTFDITYIPLWATTFFAFVFFLIILYLSALRRAWLIPPFLSVSLPLLFLVVHQLTLAVLVACVSAILTGLPFRFKGSEPPRKSSLYFITATLYICWTTIIVFIDILKKYPVAAFVFGIFTMTMFFATQSARWDKPASRPKDAANKEPKTDLLS